MDVFAFVCYLVYIVCEHRKNQTPTSTLNICVLFIVIATLFATPNRFRQRNRLPDFERGCLAFRQHAVMLGIFALFLYSSGKG